MNRGYHAHIYYDPQKTRPIAERLCADITSKFQAQLGGLRATSRSGRIPSPTPR